MAKFKETEIKHVEKVEVSANKLRGLADLLEKTFKTKDNVMVDLYVVPGVVADNMTFAFDFPEPEPKQSAEVVPDVTVDKVKAERPLTQKELKDSAKAKVTPEVPVEPKVEEKK